MPLAADHDLGRGAVVAGKEDQRVVETLHRLERRDDPPDLLVHRLDHRGMDRHLRRLEVLLLGREPLPLKRKLDLPRPERVKCIGEGIGGAEVALDLRQRSRHDSRGELTGMAGGADRLPARPVALAVFRDAGLGRVERKVGGSEGDVLEERFSRMIDGVAAETSHRMVSNRGRSVEVIALRMRLSLHSHAAGIEKVALASASDIERTVKALRERRSVNMPFARVVAAVARGFEELWQEFRPRGTLSLGPTGKSLAAIAGRERIATNRLWIKPSKERRPTRPAAGRARGLREPQSPARQPIKVRRVDLAAVGAEIGEAEIVGEDHHHVRLLWRSLRRRGWRRFLHRWRGDEILAVGRAEQLSQRRHGVDVGRIVGKVHQLARIGVVVVELPPCRPAVPLRVAVTAGPQAHATHAATLDFGERRPVGERLGSPPRGDERREAAAVAGSRGERHAGEITDRRANVDQFHRHLRSRADRAAEPGGHGDHQRHPGALLEQALLLPEVVLAEVIAVVAGEDDDRVVGEPKAVEGPDDLPNLRIDERHRRPVGLKRLAAEVAMEPHLLRLAAGQGRLRHMLVVIGRHVGKPDTVERMAIEPGFRRDIRGVRPEETDGEEERGLVVRKGLQPRHGLGRSQAVGLLRVAPLGREPTDRAAELPRLEREHLPLVGLVAPLGIEDGIPTRRIVEPIGADLPGHAVVIELSDPLDAVAGGAEGLRQRHHAGVEITEADGVVTDAGPRRTPPGEEARPARIAERILTVGPGEADATGGELVDVRRDRLRVAVAAKRAAEVVADHKQDVRPGGIGPGRLTGDPDAQGQDGREPTDDHRTEPGVHRRNLRWKRRSRPGPRKGPGAASRDR